MVSKSVVSIESNQCGSINETEIYQNYLANRKSGVHQVKHNCVFFFFITGVHR